MAKRLSTARAKAPAAPRPRVGRMTTQRYARLLEDVHDLAKIAERRDEKPIRLRELERRLKADGLL